MYRLFFITCIFLLTVLSLNADLAIIVNKANAITEISQLDIQNIYSGKKTSWDDGKPIEAAFLTNNEATDIFLKDIIKKTLPQYTNFWKKAVFTGTGNPPKEFNSPDEMKKFISSNANALGFILNSHVDNTVKKIEIK